MCSIIIFSLRKLTSGSKMDKKIQRGVVRIYFSEKLPWNFQICDFALRDYHAYSQQIALAAFKTAKRLSWSVLLDHRCNVGRTTQQGLPFCPSVCPQVFLELDHQFFLKLSMVLGVHIQLYVRQRWIFAKRSSPGKNDQKWSEMARKEFLDFLRKSSHQFCLELM